MANFGRVPTSKLADLLEEDKYEEAHALIEKHGGETVAERVGALAARRTVWLAENRVDDAAEASDLDGDKIPFERAYALYRLGRLEDVSSVESVDSRGMVLGAMVLNRRGAFGEAADAYSAALGGKSGSGRSSVEDGVWEQHVRVNLSGALLCAGRWWEAGAVDGGEEEWELAYQKACAEAESGDFVGACAALWRSGEVAEREEGEGAAATSRLQRAALLHRLLWREEAAKEASGAEVGEDAVLSAVARNNDTAARRDRKDVVEGLRRVTDALDKDAKNPRLTPGQVSALKGNQLVLLVALGKDEEAMELSRQLEERYPLSATPVLARAALLARQATKGAVWPFGAKRGTEEATALAKQALDAAQPVLEEWLRRAWVTLDGAQGITGAPEGMASHAADGSVTTGVHSGGVGAADGGVTTVALSLTQLLSDAGQRKTAADILRPRTHGGWLPPAAAYAAPVLVARWELVQDEEEEEEATSAKKYLEGVEEKEEAVTSAKKYFVEETREAVRWWTSAVGEKLPFAKAASRAVLHSAAVFARDRGVWSEAAGFAKDWAEQSSHHEKHIAEILHTHILSRDPSHSDIASLASRWAAPDLDALAASQSDRVTHLLATDAVLHSTSTPSSSSSTSTPAVQPTSAPTLPTRRNRRSAEARARRKMARAQKFRDSLKDRLGVTTDDDLVPPDPERWLPLAERSRRGKAGRRRKGPSRTAVQRSGAQGAKIDAKTAASLDAKARTTKK